MTRDFFTTLDALLATSKVVIDRPRSTAHPRSPEAVYPVDYGHLRGTTSADGEGVDVFIGSAGGAGLVAVALTADPVKRDVEVKLLLDCTPAEVSAVHAFLAETLGIGGLVVRRQ